MAIFQGGSTNSASPGYRAPAQAMSIKALQSRMKAAQEAALQAQQVQNPIPDPMSGIAHLGGVLATSLGSGMAESRENAGRQQLAQAMAGINPDTGPTPEQMAQINMLDPDMGAKMYENAMRARQEATAREDAQAHDLEMQGGQQTFTAGQNEANRAAEDARQKALFGHQDTSAEAERTATSAENELNRQADIARAKVQEAAAAGRQEDQQAAAQELAELNARLDAEKAKASEAAKVAAIPQVTAAREAEADRLGLKPGTQERNDYVLTGDYTTPAKLKIADAMSPGAIKTDQDAAAQINEWKTTGGPNMATAVAKTSKAIDLLKNGDITGFRQGLADQTLHPALAKLYNPDGTIARDSVRDVVQETLRATLGAQFTQQEGEALMGRAFDPYLDESENLRRAQILLQQVSQIALNKQEMADYWDANNQSLLGYKGGAGAPDVMQTLRDLAEGKNTGGAPAATAAPAEEDDDAFVKRLLQGGP